MSKNYNTVTASLKTTIADVAVLDAKQIKLKDRNILDYIKESEFDNYDARDPQLKNDELDVWNTAISISEEGHIEVKPHVHSTSGNAWSTTLEGITDSQFDTLKTAVKIIDNEVLGDNDTHIMYWQADGLTKGYYMFNQCENLTTFSSDLSSLQDGHWMFSGTSLTSFSGDLSNLVNGYEMFAYCENLTSFSSDLSSLEDGQGMFSQCTNLTSFSIDLPNLTNGYSMFYFCENLTSFNQDLSSLIYGSFMFEGCYNLTSFKGDLSSLTSGDEMFAYCENLTSFSSDLSSLEGGVAIFTGCKLDASSVANIIHTLPIYETSGNIWIGIGCDNTEEDKLLFAQECDCETWQELLDDFSAKNCTVRFECNGRPTTTYNMRRVEILPIYAKLEEVIMPTNEKEHKPHYQYTSVDGSKFFNIKYFHSTNGSTEGYDVFSSLEEAISTYNVTSKN